MTPEPDPDPPAPILPEITVDVKNALGVHYVGNSFPDVGDFQTYGTVSFNGVSYSLDSNRIFAIPRSANDGDTIKIGWATGTANNASVLFDCVMYSYVSGSGSTTVYSASAYTMHPGTNPDNAEFDATINSSTEYVLRVIQ